MKLSVRVSPLKPSPLVQDIATAAALVGLFLLIRNGRERRRERETKLAQLERTVQKLERKVLTKR